MALWSKVGMLFVIVLVLLLIVGAMFYFEFFPPLADN
jgi:hypothetical protein